jgi:hypothetical protein
VEGAALLRRRIADRRIVVVRGPLDRRQIDGRAVVVGRRRHSQSSGEQRHQQESSHEGERPFAYR